MEKWLIGKDAFEVADKVQDGTRWHIFKVNGDRQIMVHDRLCTVSVTKDGIIKKVKSMH